MDKVTILNSYQLEEYTLHRVKPEGFIDFGGKRDSLAFDYAALAVQWGIEKESLDMITAGNLTFKEAMSVNIKETRFTPERTVLISAEVVPDILVKLRDSGRNPGLDTQREIITVKKMISVVGGKKS
ncbi:hypothetical protein [Cohnella sp. AR92]|uniref:hypothetical protein n=1 Tax=Cohnella sp. AR92 TaxID=648716 RepID=UPI000F8D8144|nr:hypothetical protein [Cohnella sp. AR92]RUS47609.1 hypothetical protein ELR57_07420 [Cohnella sp. AR92]